jgi:hypothetical protein
MQPETILQIARDGAVIDTLPFQDLPAALESGRLLRTDHYLDPVSNTWRSVADLIPSPATAQSPGNIVSKDGNLFYGGLAAVVLVVLGFLVVSQPHGGDSRVIQSAATQAAEAASVEDQLKRAELKLAELSPRFTSKTDKFEGITWYRHVDRDALMERFLKSGQGGLLEVDVNSSGSRYMISNYVGSTPIRYQFVLFIVDGVKQKGTLGPSSDDKTTEFTDNGVVERCFHLWDEDRKFLGVLAAAARSGKAVSCRLTSVGSNIVYDWDPCPDELRVLADSVELADALREKREAASAAGIPR